MSSFDPQHLAYCEIDGTLIFLDIAADRYFCLTDAGNHKMHAAIDLPLSGSWHQPSSFPRPADWTAPTKSIPAMHTGRFQIAEVARAIWLQRRIERRLVSTSLAQVLGDVCRITASRKTSRPITDIRASQIIRAFEQAKLLRTAADRCLPRSIALALCLAARGVKVQVVIGVKLAQFGAHCWAQAGDEVLNDSAEEALRHSPILVI